MRSDSGDKIAVIRRADEKGALHWLYFSVRDDRDNGTIIDFLQNRGGGSLGEVRKTLRLWLGGAYRTPRMRKTPLPSLLPVSQDRACVLMAWERAQFKAAVPYLIGRGLGPEILGLDLFAGRVRVDQRGNALFPHYDREGLCGFEIKNKGFTGFASGGSKGLWFSQARDSDRFLVLTESAIDALSFYALHPDLPARYMSTGGTLNPKQPALLRGAMEKMPPGASVLLAFDRDEGGHALAEEVATFVPALLTAQRTSPSAEMGKDWNDVLQHKLAFG